METKKRSPVLKRAWLWLGALFIPLALVILFEALKGRQSVMCGWVFGVMAPLEQALGRLWSLFPFSVAEAFTALFLAGCVVWLVRATVLAARQREPIPLLRRLTALAAAWLWLWAGLCWLWNAAYYVPSFAQREGLDTAPYSVEELAAVTEYFARQAAALSTQVPRDEEGHFAAELSDCFDRGPDIYQNIARTFPSLNMKAVRAKPLLCSRLQSILGFTGVYFPFTGEANVNVDAPACLVPSTIGHEMAHQRMVASELEANFVGIAACTSSGDVVFQYSGYLMGLINLCNALYPAAPEAWKDIAGRCFSPELTVDWSDNNSYWAALKSPVEDAAGDVYDSFLKSNDQELGIRSYGACVDLLVNYYGRPQ
ncbi:DUF3810 domain-containing protein [Colidextribacter sp. OB.20]|uniref:DUF3810 domain-containing protein n=1 Tax=Colidextribacter sp. OB.20 TaxID=2304568 RepID=UPI0013689216|nr:DUF3810 domain-containing protein [Colidextribacter sp. OB.20]NBI09390.1 DUF3810 domain-containing protein [Colidextribacter sp. OB.20]